MMCMMMHAMDHSGHGSETAAPHAERESLLDILKGRYARGEITKDQFEQMKRELSL